MTYPLIGITHLDKLIQRKNDGWEQLPKTWPDCLRRVLAARGIGSEADLTYDLAELPKPDEMLGMSEASKLMAQAVMEQWRIMIVADFDTDGATSCAVAIRGLLAMGALYVDYIVPNRFIHGYGLTPELLADVPTDNQPDLLMTVDNGIASLAGVRVAHDRGIKVVVTDHHLQGDVLPDADAIINPNQRGDTFPSKNIAGVGVCFYLLLGLRQQLRAQGWFEQQQRQAPPLQALLDLVALGTVADVVPLDKLNRTFVHLGLARIRAGRACAGIKALIQVSGRDVSKLASQDMGFSIAPRLNAAGRLEDMSLGIEALLMDDDSQALTAAQTLDDINKQRREVEQDMQTQALSMLPEIAVSSEQETLGYCLFDPSWHQGVIGLLASRIKERQHRPVIAFAPGNEGEVKGSARSIPGVHIRDVLALVASQAPVGMLTRFGGHAMAAGLTLDTEDLPLFERLFLKVLKDTIDPSVLRQDIVTDGELSTEEITLPLAEFLPTAAPWGQGFSEPTFHGTFIVDNCRAVGQQQDHLRLSLRLNNKQVITAMAFRQTQAEWLQQGRKVTVCYRLAVNEFRQQRSVQMIVDTLLPV